MLGVMWPCFMAWLVLAVLMSFFFTMVGDTSLGNHTCQKVLMMQSALVLQLFDGLTDDWLCLSFAGV